MTAPVAFVPEVLDPATPLPVEQIVEKVRAYAEAYPDFVYTPDTRRNIVGACTYAPNEPNPCGCIVGAALVAVGLEYSCEWEGRPALTLIDWLYMKRDWVPPTVAGGAGWLDCTVGHLCCAVPINHVLFGIFCKVELYSSAPHLRIPRAYPHRTLH